ncbi:MAG: hypothetical protein M5U34_43715 [Chloroflexi bacterium]|nr:hypothetical protein [Chloroflexota bacterium]
MMEKTISSMSSREFESLIGQVIDRRMEVWLTQLLDAIGDTKEEDEAEFQPQFLESLARSRQQSASGGNRIFSIFF